MLSYFKSGLAAGAWVFVFACAQATDVDTEDLAQEATAGEPSPAGMVGQAGQNGHDQEAAEGVDPASATDGADETGTTGDGTHTTPTGDDQCLKGGADFEQAGPYAVTTVPGPAGYTVYHPDPMEGDCLHPMVAWGNGYLITGTTPHEALHQHLSSWGFVVIVPHQSGVGTGSHHRVGLDWLLEQHVTDGSIFEGRLAEYGGVAGHSQGGQGANNAADHPNVAAVACIQCITQGCSPSRPGSCGPAVVTSHPRLCLTADTDTALEPTMRTYDASEGPSFFAQWGAGANHLTPLWTGIESDAGQQYLRLYAAWFRCFLAGDSHGCGLFEGGESCEVCGDAGWTQIMSKNFD